MGRPSGPPIPGDGIIILPPGDGEVPPPIVPPPVECPPLEGGEILVGIQDPTINNSLGNIADIFFPGETAIFEANFESIRECPLSVTLVLQVSDAILVPLPPIIKLRTIPALGLITENFRVQIPLNLTTGTWTAEFSAFASIGGVRFPIAPSVAVNFQVT